jgi:hypothetical protein
MYQRRRNISKSVGDKVSNFSKYFRSDELGKVKKWKFHPKLGGTIISPWSPYVPTPLWINKSVIDGAEPLTSSSSTRLLYCGKSDDIGNNHTNISDE